MLVDADRLPGGQLDPESVEAGARQMRRDAVAVREAGLAVVNAWQGLRACYETPDADQALRALDPVRAGTGKLADDLEQVAKALDRFADDVRSLHVKRRGLAGQINDFRARVTAEGNTLGELSLPGVLDPQLSFENTTLLSKSRLLGEEFETAELECANKIKSIGHPATLIERAQSWAQDAGDWLANAGKSVADGIVAGGEAVRDWAQGMSRTVNEWFDNRLDDINTGIDTGREWIDDTASDIGGWFEDRATDVSDWYQDTSTDIGHWYEDTSADVGNWFVDRGRDVRAFGQSVHDNWPRTTQIGAAQLLALGQRVSNGVFFRDGEAYAEPPKPVEIDRDPEKHDVPYGLDDLTEQVTKAYLEGPGEVRVTTVETPDGPRVIVSVPGTQRWLPWTNDNPMDLTGNLVTAMGGDESTMTAAVRLAMEQADIPEGAQVMMVGHSQGGMTVANLAEDSKFVEKYNITNAVTFGSPIDSNRIDPNVNVLELQHATDAVPRLDMEDALYDGPFSGPSIVGLRIGGLPSGHVQDGANHTTVTLPNPGEWWDAGTNHAHQEYSNSLRESAGDPRLAAYEQQLRDAGFLVDPPQDSAPWLPGKAPVTDTWPSTAPQVSAEYIRVGRKQPGE
jgi:hypothetical protein